jgi:hypothetical protein
MFDPRDLNQQETAYFNRAVGHAYGAIQHQQKAGSAWWGSAKRNESAAANSEIAGENSDINAVCTMLRRRNIIVPFREVFEHVQARARTLINGHRSYSYGGYSYPSYPMSYYQPVGGYNYWTASDVMLGAAYGVLLYDAIELSYQQQELSMLEQQNYFSDFNNGGFNDVITTNDFVVDDGSSGAAWGDDVGAGVMGNDGGFVQNDSYTGDAGGGGGGWGGDDAATSQIQTDDNSGGGWGGGSATADDNTSGGGDNSGGWGGDAGGGASVTTDDNSGGGWGGGGGGSDDNSGGGGGGWDSGGSSGGGDDSF